MGAILEMGVVKQWCLESILEAHCYVDQSEKLIDTQSDLIYFNPK